MSECILVVDDDREIVRAIAILLEKEGYQVLKAYDGMQALELIAEQKVHLVIMDVMMPKLDGLSAVLKIRERKNIPIIVLSAKSEDTDKVLGLSMGADDYVTKPFGMMEFLARVKAVLRRSKKHSSKKEYHYKTLTVNVERHQVFDNDRAVELTLKEFELLRYLVENKGIVLSRDEILEKIWGYECAGETRTVDVHIRTLRQKLGDSGFLIETVRGVGYRIGDSQ